MPSTMQRMKGMGLMSKAFPVIVVVTMFFVFFGILYRAGHTVSTEQTSCVAAGGHFVSEPFTANECWSLDGTRRLFPKGF